MQKVIHSPGIIPTFALGFSRGTSDLNDPGAAWRGIPGNVGFPNRYTFINEVVPDDSNYLSQGLGNLGALYWEDLGPPILGAGHINYSFRIRTMGGTNPALCSAAITLLRGGTLVHNEIIPFLSIGTAFVTFVVGLTAGEITTLYGVAGNMQMQYSGGGGPATDALECAWSEVAFYA